MHTIVLRVALAGLLSIASFGAMAQAGKATYDKACGMCHGPGVAGAPKFGVAQDWAPRIARGAAELYKSALQGTAKGMPPRGGHADLSDADVKAAVDYMVAAAKAPSAKSEPARPAAAAAPASASAPAATSASASAPALAAAAAPAASSTATTGVAAADVNNFNRLLRPPAKRNAPPTEDGIHDPEGDGTPMLQPPLAAFGSLPRSTAGNRVNWVAALDQKRIQPRWDRNDANAPPVVMDLNIIREVKGSMPDVLYPHKQHTEWLDCSNCHPAIFVPQKGANVISMAQILLGQKCGVCHGKVAFPVSECRLCHSQKKDPALLQRTQAATPAATR